MAGSCAAEDVRDGVSGFLIEENAASMASMLERLMDAPEQMRRVGESAQREIYISWEDAVKNARERYGDVIDNYRRGLYPAHDSLGDEFFHGMAELMDVLKRRREVQQQILANLRLTERAAQYRRLQQQLREGLQSGAEDLRRELAEDRQRVLELLNEYYRHIDRFY